MAHGKLYRSFIILQEDEKGHSIANDKPLSGYAKVEVRNDRCKVAFYAQNLKKDYGKCSMMLICNKKDTEVLLDLGTMNITPQGKAEISIEFDANNIGNSGVSYDKVVGASLCKKDTGNLKSLMCGFLNGEKPTSNWKGYKKLVCVKPEAKVSEVKPMKEVPTMPKEKKETPVTKKVAPVTEKVMPVVEKTAPVTEKVEKAKVSMDKKTECGCVKSRSKYDEYESYIDNSDIEEGKIVAENVSEEEKRESDTKLEKQEKESNSSIEEESRKDEESKQSENEKMERLEKEEREEVKEKEETKEREETKEESEEKEETKEERKKENDEYANYKDYERRRYSNSEEGQIGKYTYQEEDDDFTLRGTLGEFFETVVDSLEQTRCTNEIRKCKWYKVPVKSFDSMCNIADYNKYTALYYPMTNYYPYISKHGHFLVGLKCDKYGNVKYLVYGIKGSKEKGQQPYDGKTGFVTWTSAPELGKDMGYWLMFYDFKNNIVVVPSK